MRRHISRNVVAVLLLFLAAGCAYKGEKRERTEPGSDAAARALVELLRASQPAPYGLPEESTSNYWWAQNVLAFLAADRCGYMSRTEAVARISGMLDPIERVERHHGFWYDAYNTKTGKKTTDKIYFQGWWLYSLCILKNAYPELAPRCEKMLAAMDYEGSGLFNAETRQLAADYYPEEKRVSFWIDLYWQPTGEFRTPYVAYTYLTGDITPWTRWATPRTIDLEGHPVLGVWHNFFFCSMYVHSVFPDLGYLERSWNEMLLGLDLYRKRNGMVFYPTRAEPLEAWRDVDTNSWPNTEHRVAKSWLAWFGDVDAPVMEKAWSPGYGPTLYDDNMNFYWSFGDEQIALTNCVGTDAQGTRCGGRYSLPFEAMLLPDAVEVPNPPKLTSVKLVASHMSDAAVAPLDVSLNGQVIASFDPSQMGREPAVLSRALDGIVLTNRSNTLTISTADKAPGHAYLLYSRGNDLWKAFYSCADRPSQQVQAPYVEITINGQQDGRENPYALLARCAVVHGYYVWHEMLHDPKFHENTVVWVGDYCDRARIGRVVHNVSDKAVTVRYERPADWVDATRIRVADVTADAKADVAAAVRGEEVLWLAEPRHTYRLSYAK